MSYSGKIYQNKWWTQGNAPDTNSGSGLPWAYLGDCAGIFGDFAVPTTVISNIYPNPTARGTITVDVNALQGQLIELIVFDVNTMNRYGRATQYAAVDGLNTVVFSLASAPQGQLVVFVRTPSGYESRMVFGTKD